MRTRVYRSSDWAVRRWDSVNRGVQIDPLSFCQFWRTVLLWATLQKFLPGYRFLFESMVEEATKPPSLRSRPAAPPPSKPSTYKPILLKLLKLIWWPFDKIFSALWWCCGTVAEFFDDRPRLRNTVSSTGSLAFIAVIVGCAVFCLFAIGFLVYDLFRRDWFLDHLSVVVGSVLGIVLGCALVFFGILRFHKQIESGLSAIGSLLHMGWDMAVANKKRVCPPIKIVRGS